MKNAIKILALSVVLFSCGKDDEAMQLPFDSFNFSYRIGDHDLNNNPYYFINGVGSVEINRNPVAPGYVPEECDLRTELTETVFSFTCDCSVSTEDGTIDYIISMRADRSTEEMVEAVIRFPQYNVSYNWVDIAIYTQVTVQNDEGISMSTVSNPSIPNNGNPVELSINYRLILEP